MDPRHRRYTRLPATELFDETGHTIPARKLRFLSSDDLRQLLREGPLEFVVISLSGEYAWRPRWIPLADCFDFWKAHAAPRLCDSAPVGAAHAYPDGSCYQASEWVADDRPNKIVLLEEFD